MASLYEFRIIYGRVLNIRAGQSIRLEDDHPRFNDFFARSTPIASDVQTQVKHRRLTTQAVTTGSLARALERAPEIDTVTALMPEPAPVTAPAATDELDSLTKPQLLQRLHDVGAFERGDDKKPKATIIDRLRKLAATAPKEG